MTFEHFALNVPNAPEMAAWYVRHCGMKIVLQQDAVPHTRFLADRTGRVTMEIYTNPAAPVPDYTDNHHLSFHCAFAVTDALGDMERLKAAGATHVETLRPDEQTILVMLRDPWGIPLQLCQRGKPF